MATNKPTFTVRKLSIIEIEIVKKGGKPDQRPSLKEKEKKESEKCLDITDAPTRHSCD